MNVTKDVIVDLLPVYMAGDASPDTRALVDEFLRADPDLGLLVDRAMSADLTPQNLKRPESLDSLEWASLGMTRRLLQRRAWTLAFASAMTLIPFVFVFSGGKLVWMLFRDQPAVAGGFALAGISGWIAFLDTCRRLSATGFEPPRTWKTRVFWAVGGALLGILCGTALHPWIGSRWLSFFPTVGMMLATALGQRWRQFAAPEEIARPISLFGDRK